MDTCENPDFYLVVVFVRDGAGTVGKEQQEIRVGYPV
jgi:hypothetical protein